MLLTLDKHNVLLMFIWRISVFYSVGSRGGNNPRVVSGQKLTNNGTPNRKNTADLYAGGMQLLFLVLVLFTEVRFFLSVIQRWPDKISGSCDTCLGHF